MTGGGPPVLIVNPRATRVRPGDEAALAVTLGGTGGSVVVARSAADTVVQAHRAVAAGFGVVGLLGGDGTVAAVAAAVAGTGAALLPLPGGSTNVFSRGVGWPSDWRRCLPLLPAALAGARREVRLGALTLDGGPPHVMCVNLGVGLDGAAVRWVETHPGLKHGLRQMAFALAILGPGVREMRRGTPVAVSDGGGRPVRVATVIVACGRPYAFAGPLPLDLLPNASWDGRLEWVGLTSAAPLPAARALLGALRGGRHLARPRVVGGRTGGEVRIRAGRPMPVQVDGETLGEAREVVVRPGARLAVVVPAPGAA